MKGIADTGFLVAFANREHRYHHWAVGVAEQVSEPLLSCEAVLAEAAFHLRSVLVVLAIVRDGPVLPAFDCTAHLEPRKSPSRTVTSFGGWYFRPEEHAYVDRRDVNGE